MEMYAEPESRPLRYEKKPSPKARARRKRRLFAIMAALGVIALMIALISIPKVLEQQKVKRYNLGAEYLEKGDYLQAEEIFTSLGDFEDAPLVAAYARRGVVYTAAKESMAAGEFDRAAESFASLGGFKDADALAEECTRIASFRKGEELFSAGSYADALEALKRAEGYGDSLALMEECTRIMTYQRGEELFNAGSYAEAVEVLSQTDGYGDSEALIRECRMIMAAREIEDAMARKDFDQALALLDGEYGSALENREEKISLCRMGKKYILAREAYDSGLYYTAWKLFRDLGTYDDAAARAQACVIDRPRTGETYHNGEYTAKGCTLTIKLNNSADTYTYFKIYLVSGSKEILVSCVFLNGGTPVTVSLPAGSYVLKTATGKGSWYGEKEMFGDSGSYQRLLYNSGSDTFPLEKNGEYTLTLNVSSDGNVGSKKESMASF